MTARKERRGVEGGEGEREREEGRKLQEGEREKQSVFTPAVEEAGVCV